MSCARFREPPTPEKENLSNRSWDFLRLLDGNRNCAMLRPHDHRGDIVAELKPQSLNTLFTTFRLSEMGL